MVWVCQKCGHGNLDNFEKCINCNIECRFGNKTTNCWDFNNCKEKQKIKCKVFIAKMGRECWTLHNIKKGCLGNNNKPCFKCEWYNQIIHESKVL